MAVERFLYRNASIRVWPNDVQYTGVWYWAATTPDNGFRGAALTRWGAKRQAKKTVRKHG